MIYTIKIINEKKNKIKVIMIKKAPIQSRYHYRFDNIYLNAPNGKTDITLFTSKGTSFLSKFDINVITYPSPNQPMAVPSDGDFSDIRDTVVFYVIYRRPQDGPPLAINQNFYGETSSQDFISEDFIANYNQNNVIRCGMMYVSPSISSIDETGTNYLTDFTSTIGAIPGKDERYVEETYRFTNDESLSVMLYTPSQKYYVRTDGYVSFIID